MKYNNISVWFGSLKFATENRTTIFGFLYNKTEIEPNRNFCIGSVGLKRFFRFLGFLHTLAPSAKKLVI